MVLLDVVTILCAGSLLGNELAVSVFINPALEKVDPSARRQLTSLLARTLGRAMPWWYAATLGLLGVETFVRRHDAAGPLLAAAAAIWVAIIAGTIVWLLPLNARIGADDAELVTLHRRWDRRHWVRIAGLVVAVGCAGFGLCGGV